MKSLIVSKNEIAEMLTIPELIEGIIFAYKSHSSNKSVRPKKVSTNINDTSIVVTMPGHLPNSSKFTIKVNVKTPQNIQSGLPFINGSILLFDGNNGRLLSVMDSGLITAMRTGAAGAIGVDILANKNENNISLIGAGTQAEWQIRALHSIRQINNVHIFDIHESQSKKLQNKLFTELNIKSTIVQSLKEAVDKCDILILTTQSKTPIITSDMLHPGLHINAFGADQPGKVELDSSVINKSIVIVDDNALALTDGALNVPYTNMQLISDSYSEIGDFLLSGISPRTSSNDISIFANVGLAFQDLVACTIIYEKAIKLRKGTWIDFDNSNLNLHNNHSTLV